VEKAGLMREVFGLLCKAEFYRQGLLFDVALSNYGRDCENQKIEGGKKAK